MKLLYMDVTTMPASTSPNLFAVFEQIRKDHPQFQFDEAQRFSWHAGQNRVTFTPQTTRNIRGIWALLHELSHAILKHQDFTTDIELLQMEVAAWEHAKYIAPRYVTSIDEDYIQSCLDSYRDWLHVRATCPTCYERSLQIDRHTYRCHNCKTTWRVTRSRLCRPYRKKG